MSWVSLSLFRASAVPVPHWRHQTGHRILWTIYSSFFHRSMGDTPEFILQEVVVVWCVNQSLCSALPGICPTCLLVARRTRSRPNTTTRPSPGQWAPGYPWLLWSSSSPHTSAGEEWESLQPQRTSCNWQRMPSRWETSLNAHLYITSEAKKHISCAVHNVHCFLHTKVELRMCRLFLLLHFDS